MKIYKAQLLVLGFALSTLFSLNLYAGPIEDQCRQDNPQYVPGMIDNAANHGVIVSYQMCVSEGYRMQQEQQNAPPHPGNPPAYNCEQYNTPFTQTSFMECKANYQAAKADYDAKLASYNQYQTDHPNMHVAATPSATQLLEDVAAKQQRAIDRLQMTKTIVNTLGGLLIAIGTIMLMVPGAGSAGWYFIGAGGALIVIGLFIQARIQKLTSDKITTCQQYNKIATKPIDCPNAQEMTTVDGIIPINANPTATANIPEFIDQSTGLCKGNAPAECQALVSEAPKDCFKKGSSCLAGGKVPKINVLKSGEKITVSAGGKSKTYGLDDFQSEAAMVKAGFTPAQAKKFMSALNSPDGVLGRNGVNSKGELKEFSKGSSTSLSPAVSGSSSGSSSSGSANGMKMQKDEYKVAPPSEVAKAPTEEGVTKDFNGDEIGAGGDDLFKMMNRRYQLKSHQNIFLEQ